MNWRFRKRVKIMPGLWINLSKGTPSLSVGGNGATLNVSKRGLKGTLGLPGSGLSVSETVPWPKHGGGNQNGHRPPQALPPSQPDPEPPKPRVPLPMPFAFNHFASVAGLDEQINTAIKEGNFEQAANIKVVRDGLYARFPETAPVKDEDFLSLLGKAVTI